MRPDGQKPDMRHARPDEWAYDHEVLHPSKAAGVDSAGVHRR
jgi:hypothetical protein